MWFTSTCWTGALPKNVNKCDSLQPAEQVLYLKSKQMWFTSPRESTSITDIINDSADYYADVNDDNNESKIVQEFNNKHIHSNTGYGVAVSSLSDFW